MESKSNLTTRSPLDSMAQTPDLTIAQRKLLRRKGLVAETKQFIVTRT